MSRFEDMFQQAVKLYGGVRSTARLTGISSATISRLVHGKPLDPKTAAVLGPAIGVCPCCEQDWPAEPSHPPVQERTK